MSMADAPNDKREDWQRGLAVFSEMFGQARANKWAVPEDAARERLADLLLESVYGRVWGNELLTRRDRSLVTVALLAALGKEDELAIHAKAAFSNGCSVAELHEVMIQVIIYCGFPAGLSGDRILRRTEA